MDQTDSKPSDGEGRSVGVGGGQRDRGRRGKSADALVRGWDSLALGTLSIVCDSLRGKSPFCSSLACPALRTRGLE